MLSWYSKLHRIQCCCTLSFNYFRCDHALPFSPRAVCTTLAADNGKVACNSLMNTMTSEFPQAFDGELCSRGFICPNPVQTYIWPVVHSCLPLSMLTPRPCLWDFLHDQPETTLDRAQDLCYRLASLLFAGAFAIVSGQSSFKPITQRRTVRVKPSSFHLSSVSGCIAI
jgi:hypothetical protein